MKADTIIVLCFVTAIVVTIGSFVICQALDVRRIKKYFKVRNFNLIRLKWKPFGCASEGQVFEVVYEDANKQVHSAYIRTIMFGKMWFAEDRIINNEQFPSSS